ncbi:MAG: ABC transporter permease [Anaerolineales bacterium]|nr:ABC transporter permease [Anaerolineales bacterium]MCS7246979.1 ABC transporter permease [Anaerolineales bacterium]MDW8160790.1 ABC transporter permease [Anaerolineales bacterium]MDW8447771.1 ABC transporter permease [Anaerolineales bacterium]
MHTSQISPFLAFWRSFRLATWLGWQIESNWADPFLFTVYSLIKPISSAAILVVMYSVITRADFTAPIFPYIYLGNAFYMYVGQVMTGISWAVIDDREHYKTMKYIYTAPVHFPAYLLGRGVARFIIASISVLVTIVFGVLFLEINIEVTQVNWAFFLITLFTGVVMLALMGLTLAGVMLLLVHHMFGVGEAVAGALYLFSGAIFPLEVLPSFLRPIGFLMPITYWLELLRRLLVGDVASSFPTLQTLTNVQLYFILVVLTVFFAAFSILTFRACENRARELGLIDTVTNY